MGIESAISELKSPEGPNILDTSVWVCTRLHTYVTYLRDQVFELWRNKNSNSFLHTEAVLNGQTCFVNQNVYHVVKSWQDNKAVF